MDLFLESAITWSGSISAYGISGLLMFICVMMYAIMSYFYIKACRKMTKYSTVGSYVVVIGEFSIILKI